MSLIFQNNVCDGFGAKVIFPPCSEIFCICHFLPSVSLLFGSAKERVGSMVFHLLLCFFLILLIVIFFLFWTFLFYSFLLFLLQYTILLQSRFKIIVIHFLLLDQSF
jgi:hypothetical protein